MAEANSINSSAAGIVTNTGTGFTSSTVTQHGVLVGGASNAVSSTSVGSTGQVLQANSSADPTYSTATYPSTATGTGKILRADGTNWVATTATYPNTAGTSGNVLTSDGTNWNSSASSGVGGWVKITTTTASSSASISFNDTAYSNYVLVVNDSLPATNTTTLQCQFTTNSGSTYVATSYQSGLNNAQYNSASFGNTSSTTFTLLAGAQDSAGSIGISGTFFFYGFNTPTANFSCRGNATFMFGGQTFMAIAATGHATTGANGIKITFSSGNIASGTFTWYGLAT